MKRLLTRVNIVWCILFAAIVTAWLRSHIRSDSIVWHTRGGDRYTLISSRGTLLFERYCNEASCAAPLPPPGWQAVSHGGAPEDLRRAIWPSARQWRVSGYGVISRSGPVRPPARSARPGGWTSTVLLVPHWLLLPITCVGPVLALRHRHRGAGSCQRCGYDLTGNLSGRCPECGTIASALFMKATAGPLTPRSSGGQA